jgi:vacuolar-type H+-ATPase subunit E/Vma4
MAEQNIEEKLQKFRDAVFREVKKNIKAKDSAAKQQCADELQQFELQLDSELQLQEKQQKAHLEQESSRRLGQSSREQHQAVLLCRKEAIAQIEEKTKARIADYLATDSYQKQLLAAIQAFLQQYGASGQVFYLRAEDLPLAKQADEKANFCADRQNKLGGFAVADEAKGLYYDYTIASRFQSALEQLAKEI